MLMKHVLHLLTVLLLVGSISSGIKAENIRYEWGVYQLSGDTAVFLKEIWWVESGGHGWYPPGPPYGFYVCDTVINENTGKSHVVTALAGRYKAGERPTYSNINCGEDWIKIFRIPNTVKYIGDGACGCERGSSFPPITLDLNPDNNVLMVGDKSFYANQFNNWLYLPKVLSIGRSAFENCKEMPGVTLGNALHTVKERAFAGCMFGEIELGDAIETIGNEAFLNCTALASVNIKGSPASIGFKAFADCGSLNTFNFNGTPTAIGDSAFARCGALHSLSFNGAPDTIGAAAFAECLRIMDLEIGDPQKWSHTVFKDEYSNPISIAVSFTTGGRLVRHLDLKAGDRGISPYAFNSAAKLVTARVTGGGVIGRKAFRSCRNMTHLCLDVDRIEKNAFFGNESLKKVYCLSVTPPDADEEAFSRYSGITLLVPRGSADTYRRHPVWCRFSDIEESDFFALDAIFKADYYVSGTEDISPDSCDDGNATTRIFSLDGRYVGDSLDTLRPGIYIIRQSSEARKIMVR